MSQDKYPPRDTHPVLAYLNYQVIFRRRLKARAIIKLNELFNAQAMFLVSFRGSDFVFEVTSNTCTWKRVSSPFRLS
jgi:hypothetical protein